MLGTCYNWQLLRNFTTETGGECGASREMSRVTCRRYHKEERVWITRAPGMVPSEKTATYERGTYYFFDVNCWRKVPKEFHLDYDKLEDRPSLPSSLTGGGGVAVPGPGAQQGGGGVGPGGPPHHPVSGSPSPLVPPLSQPPGSQPSGGSNAL